MVQKSEVPGLDISCRIHQQRTVKYALQSNVLRTKSQVHVRVTRTSMMFRVLGVFVSNHSSQVVKTASQLEAYFPTRLEALRGQP